MPRRARMYLPNFTYHIVQRGNNRQPCFFEESDYSVYLNLLAELTKRYEVDLHAYVLMTNHVHFLMTPTSSDGISSLTRVLGSRFAQIMNKKYCRTGSLWEGRHKSSVIDSNQYLLTCYRYIELNPVSAGMVDCPEEYLWSSYGVNAWGDDGCFVTPHTEYMGLGKNKEERVSRYRKMFAERLPSQDIESIRRATHYCQPLGDEAFRRKIAAELGRPVGYMGRGRPRRLVKI